MDPRLRKALYWIAGVECALAAAFAVTFATVDYHHRYFYVYREDPFYVLDYAFALFVGVWLHFGLPIFAVALVCALGLNWVHRR